MLLIEMALIILSIALIITLSVRFFWIASFIIIYRAISSVLTFEFISEKFGIDQHLFYFVFLMVIVVSVHYLIMWLTRNTLIIRYIVFIILIVWVLYKFDLREIFLLKDWFEHHNIEFTVESIKEMIVDLITTPPAEYVEIFLRFLKGISDGIQNIFDTIFNRG